MAEAVEQGFASYWAPQIFGLDTLTAIAVAGSTVPDVRFGTGVVPTYPRHPMMLAQQALTANQAIGGRLALGIGLSHKPVVEGMWGMPFDKPVRHMSEYLEVLVTLINEREISFAGKTLTSRGGIEVAAEPCPVLVAALGPQMLSVAGRKADGTITWMTGAKTLAGLTVPTICAAAEEAGRPPPEIVAGYRSVSRETKPAHASEQRRNSRSTARCLRIGQCSTTRDSMGPPILPSSATKRR